MVDGIVATILFFSRLLSLICSGRLQFPFFLELYTFICERFHFTRPTLICDLLPMLRTIARMHMWVKLFPKRVQSEWPCSAVGKDVCDMLSSEDDLDVLDLVLYPYAGMDWRGCANI